ncbi:MAG: phenylalanine--tRNA ligase subunit beta [Burkholderiales bacterium]|nr:phenylalanine--tRNA ligase subunit beta [Burkholderiales bacterium]
MQFPESWLRALVDPPIGTQELAHLLTMSGLEVESCVPVAPGFSGVVVARVLSVQRHPNAERLSLCTVDAGQGEALAIVCGAPNVAPDMKVPCALPGAMLPGKDGAPFEIRKVTMRGIESAGMLCSARELGLSDDHSGLLTLAAQASVGADLRQVLGLDDHVFLLKLTPNRADCLSLLGVAREVAALTGAGVRPPETPPVPARGDSTFPVRIAAARACGRFGARVIRNVDATAPVPEWMKRRLERAGQRSISALVDVTNYVMLELGQPLHVYDLDKLAGGIEVRFGREGESLKLLNEQTVSIDGSVLCITDGSGPIGLAGIMGGNSTKAGFATRNILLESAFFAPEAIAGRARRYNFASDASHRFERGVDFGNCVASIERATRLILDVCGGEPGPVTDTQGELPVRSTVRMRVARARRVIGVPVDTREIAGIFDRLGFAHRLEGAGDAESFEVTPPSHRFDIAIEADLIEEVARVHGFERIPAHPPRAAAAMRARSESQRTLHALRRILAERDYREVISHSFVDAGWEADFAANGEPIRLANPIANHLEVMRSTLIGSLVASLRYNQNRDIERVRVFEVARVYLRDATAQAGPLQLAGLRQPMRVAAAACGAALPAQWGTARRDVDFYDVKADLAALLPPGEARYEPAPHPALHPGRSARVFIGGAPAGWIGELHPRWQRKYELAGPALVFEIDAQPLLQVPIPRYREVSRFPPVVRDCAVVVPNAVPWQDLLGALNEARPAAVQDIRLFDLYRGQGVDAGGKSLAFRVVMQDTSRTLTDEEADAVMAGLSEILAVRFGAKVRA